MAAHIDQLIMFGAGVWMTAAGFGYLDVGARQDWLIRIIGQFRWAGPPLIVFSIILLFAP